VILSGGGRHDPRMAPDHLGLPARMSLLMLPARGWETRFVEPHAGSAV